MRMRKGLVTRSPSFFVGVVMAAAVTVAAFLSTAHAMAAPTAAGSSSNSNRKAGRAPRLTPQQSGTTNRLQAISPVNARVVWASGLGGTYVLTTDGGATWQARVVPGAESLQFRDVQGVSARVAYLLAAGPGTASRIYKTEDGGATWSLQFQNEDPNGFYDCFAFWNAKRGITMADAVDGRFPVIKTIDGEAWTDIGDQLPAASGRGSGVCRERHLRGDARWETAPGSRPAPRSKPGCSPRRTAARRWAAYGTPIVQGTLSSGAVQHRVPRPAARHPGRRGACRAHGNVGQLRPVSGRRRDLATGDPDAVSGRDLRPELRARGRSRGSSRRRRRRRRGGR